MDVPKPESALPHLADVVPSVLAAMGVAAFETVAGIDLPSPIRGACVLLVDGLGAELLDAHAAEAPVMAGLRHRTLQVGFPATTAAGLAAIGTGCRSGEHGMVGYSFRVPGAGVINALRWRPHPWGEDLRSTVVPETVQPFPTTFERAAGAGVAVRVVSGAEFAHSGLTRAVLRGGDYVGVHAIGDLGAAVADTVAGGGFCWGYHSELDLVGHLHGPGSTAWLMQLRQVDRLVESIVETLPRDGLLAVVADHGMVTADPHRSSTSTPTRPCSTVSTRSAGSLARDTSTHPTAQRTRSLRRGGTRLPTPRGCCRATRRSRRAGSAGVSATTCADVSAMSSRPHAIRPCWCAAPSNRWSRLSSDTTAR